MSKEPSVSGPEPDPRPDPKAARRRLLAAGGVAALAGAATAWWRHGRALADLPPQAGPTDPSALWALRVARPEGGELDLATLRGKPLLVNFWATWCAPCVREMPQLDQFHREFGPRGWQVLGLAIDGQAPVQDFLARVKVGFPIGLAGLDGTDLLHGLGNPQGGLPYTVMINAQGSVFKRKLGETHFDELAGWARSA